MARSLIVTGASAGVREDYEIRCAARKAPGTRAIWPAVPATRFIGFASLVAPPRARAARERALQTVQSGGLQLNLEIEEFLTGQDFPCRFVQFFNQLLCNAPQGRRLTFSMRPQSFSIWAFGPS